MASTFKPSSKITVGSGTQFITGFGRFHPATGTANVLGNGTIGSVTITDPGDGYISATDATATITSTDGANATLTAVLGNGFVVFVPVSGAGRGYLAQTPPAVSFSGGGGTGAKARAVVGPNGTITKVVVDDGGVNYTSAPTAAIAAAPSGGSNATLGTVQCSFQVTGGNITNAGSAYTQANTTLTFGNPRQAILSFGFTKIMGLNALTLDERAVASGETVKVVWPSIGNRNTTDPAYGASVLPQRRAQAVIESVTTSTYSVELQYQAQIWGR